MNMRLSLTPQQAQVQKQTMILAPRMIQSMEILQLPQMELQERIEQELSENPILEIVEKDPALPDEPVDRENPDAPAETEKECVVDSDHNNAEDFGRLEQLDKETPDYFDERPRSSSNRAEEDDERRRDAMANIVDRPESLHDHLLHQLGELELSPELRAMAERIVSALDAKNGGYLPCALEDLLPADATDDDVELAYQALQVVQRLEPAGVAARDLRECLLLQINEETPYYEELRTLISNHLEDLRDNRLPHIERITNYSIRTIKDAWEQLRKLNPKPASAFADRFAPTIAPDVSVEQDEHGRYVVKLESDHTPTLHISEYYRKRLLSGEATNDEREFIRRKVNAAQWLIEAIEQRRGTLRKVSQAIVDHQIRFLDEGPEHLAPLKMQQIADKVGVHVTTVSRAVAEKWIQTPRGILPLKRFFVGGSRNDEGEDVAWDTIRVKLQELVDHEDKSAPLSDDDLVDRLKAEGLNVARRTVTKYRQKMGIPSSRQRRDWDQG